jgi:hypothetical protein
MLISLGIGKSLLIYVYASKGKFTKTIDHGLKN